MSECTEHARAKVNLTLGVVGKRADGYHLLDSLAVFPDIGDVLRWSPAADFTLELNGPFGAVLRAEPDNLVLRAGHALAARLGIPAHGRLVLTKNLPVASGIGGGSADAAAALRLLQRAWRIEPPPDALADIALTLGADVPVCLASNPVRMEGIGEILSPAPAMPRCGMVLVNPGVAVATPAVFRALQAAFSPRAEFPAAWPDFAAMTEALGALGNDLEPPARALCPAIGDVLTALRALPGCALARMSGSGATCFALFPDAATAAAAAERVSRPGWWSWGGALG